jgi:hypothetical protein
MPQKKWIHKVKTVSSFPPGGLFTKDARLQKVRMAAPH